MTKFDLILDDKPHNPLGLVAPNDQPTITLMAAAKHSMAGFGCAMAIIPEPNTRQRFLETQVAMPQVATLAYAVTESCLRHGWPWHRELINALKQNRNTVTEWAKGYPELEVTTGHATFLAWIESYNQKICRNVCTSRGAALPRDSFWFGHGYPLELRNQSRHREMLCAEWIRRFSKNYKEPA